MKILLDIEIEKAMRMLVKYFPVSKNNSLKPKLFHDIRVGLYFYQNDYCREIILAGFLHDALEFSGITEKMIKNNFGEETLNLVKANSKDRSIKNVDKRIEELIMRCASNGEKALIIKAVDTIDSFKHYTATKNQEELKVCRKTIKAIFKYKPKNFQDAVFKELQKY